VREPGSAAPRCQIEERVEFIGLSASDVSMGSTTSILYTVRTMKTFFLSDSVTLGEDLPFLAGNRDVLWR
jgi:hypothetical protein